MARRYISSLLITAGLLGAHVAAAQEPITPLPEIPEAAAGGIAERLSALEAEVAALRARRPPAAPSGTLRPELWQLYGGGLYGGAEATILEPVMSSAPVVFGYGAVPDSLVQQQFVSGVRYQIGWVNDEGLGIRGRYWSYVNSFDFSPPFADGQLGIDVQAADLEATVTQRVGRWDALLAAGARYGKLGYVTKTPGLFGVGSSAFEGVGPTVALEGRRRLGASAWSLYGNVRGSALFGTISNKSMFTFMPRSNIAGEVMGVAENQLGVAWDRVTESGLIFEARACWETQYWMSPTLSDDVYGIGTNLALIGPTVGLQMRY